MRILVLLICVFALSGCFKTDLRAVKLVRLYDGDSFLVEDYPCLDCEEFQVRLLGIDAPEARQQVWGKKSRDRLYSLINKDKVIYLEYDIDKLDKYKRHLAYAYADAQGEELINLKMLESGHAEVFAFAKDLKYLNEFKNAEIIAKKEHRGIWSLEGGLEISPYKYRKNHRRKS